MTAIHFRSASALALTASLTLGLGACTAAPRYPIEAGRTAGEGFAPLQPRYPVRMEASAASPSAASNTLPLETASPEQAEADPAPRAAPASEVTQEELAPVVSAAQPIRPMLLAQAATAAPNPLAAPSTPPRFSTVPIASTATRQAPATFLQSGVGAGPPRFTIGAPIGPAASVLPPDPAPTPAYARPSAPPPIYARPSISPPIYARPSAPPPVYARPNPAPPAYARPSAPAYPLPTPPYAAAPYTGAPASGAIGPRPYTSLFPQGPRGPIRSAGIRSTPSNPGIAPQPLTLPPLVDASPPGAAEVASLGQGRFSWPLRGPLISGYGEKGGGQRNDGLNIAANLGDAVKAAAAGEVVYAGDLVPGSGNLVLVKHPGGWVTAYAHLSRIEVKMRDPIAQGQEIGQAGQTGGVDRPQLHFEIRYARNPQLKAAPVDPSVLLPRG